MSNKENNEKIIELLQDIIYLQSVVATELIRITENTSKILNKNNPPESCLKEHEKLEKIIINIAEKHCSDKISDLKQHVLKHQ